MRINDTYKAIGIIINENYWNLKERPEIVEIIRPHLSQSTKKKYFFTSDDINNTIGMIRKEGLQIPLEQLKELKRKYLYLK